ncbi:MAG TPA: hypothetical protein VG248_10965 [Caulobacteraceae bacterium]|nr:hypothetical protein [Caulobacteraceae bacterium]
MSLPTPRPGLVVRYAFLWSHEGEAGALEAAKARPCAIVVAVRRAKNGQILTLVAPITHAPPSERGDSIEIPARVARRLGLDAGRHWLRLDELNRFDWPGYDLRPIPGTVDRFDYGMLPKPLFEALRAAILDRHRATRGRTQNRT